VVRAAYKNTKIQTFVPTRLQVTRKTFSSRTWRNVTATPKTPKPSTTTESEEEAKKSGTQCRINAELRDAQSQYGVRHGVSTESIQSRCNQYRVDTVNIQSIYNQYRVDTESTQSRHRVDTGSIHNKSTINSRSIHRINTESIHSQYGRCIRDVILVT
jgi:hypothetical protein